MLTAFKKIQAGGFGPSSNAADRLAAKGAKEDSNQPDHTVVNLLITMFHASERIWHKCQTPPAPSVAALKAGLNVIPAFLSSNQLRAASSTSTMSGNILRWICGEFGEKIIPAGGDLRISGMPKSYFQFIVIRQDPDLQKLFDMDVAAASSKSMLLFHGTGLTSLVSVLSEGFTPTQDTGFGKGLFMSENPSQSYDYAYFRRLSPGTSWTNSPYSSFGVLLGCEVAGNAERLMMKDPILTLLITYALLSFGTSSWYQLLSIHHLLEEWG
jgi:hypothetical protein